VAAPASLPADPPPSPPPAARPAPSVAPPDPPEQFGGITSPELSWNIPAFANPAPARRSFPFRSIGAGILLLGAAATGYLTRDQ